MDLPAGPARKGCSFAKAEGFELIELLSDGFESAETLPAFFENAFRMLGSGAAEILLPLKLEGGRLLPWDPRAG